MHPSREVLDAVAHALRLDATERAYVLQLVYGPRRDSDRRAPTVKAPLDAQDRPAPAAPEGPPPSIHRLLDALGPTPALIIDRCWDLVGCNAVLAAVLPGLGPALGPARVTPDASPPNLVEYVLTSAVCRSALGDWAGVARLAVDGLRASLAGVAADDPLGTRAAALVCRLTMASPEFRAWWPSHGLWAANRPVTHVYVDPQVGRIEFDGTMLDVRSAPGLMLLTYVPSDPESADRLRQFTAQRR